MIHKMHNSILCVMKEIHLTPVECMHLYKYDYVANMQINDST
jgi:hypothetical protein